MAETPVLAALQDELRELSWRVDALGLPDADREHLDQALRLLHRALDEVARDLERARLLASALRILIDHERAKADRAPERAATDSTMDDT